MRKIIFLICLVSIQITNSRADSPAGKGIICTSTDGGAVGIEFFQHVETREKKSDIFYILDNGIYSKRVKFKDNYNEIIVFDPLDKLQSMVSATRENFIFKINRNDLSMISNHEFASPLNFGLTVNDIIASESSCEIVEKLDGLTVEDSVINKLQERKILSRRLL